MKLTIYTSESILRCLLTDMKPTVNEPKYPVWVNFINVAIADIKYRPNPFVDPEEKEEDSIKALVRSYTQKTSNESISSMTEKEIVLMYQIERCQIEYPEMIDLRKDILRARSIVILDISPVVAEYISNNYGIICHAFSTPPEESPIFYEGREVYFKKNRYGISNHGSHPVFGRERLMAGYSIKPVNSIVIIDRYLTTYDGDQEGCTGDCNSCNIDKLECNRTRRDDGKANVVALLDLILPEYLNEDFHVLLIYEVLPQKSNPKSALNNFEKWTSSFYKDIRDKIYDIRNKNHRPLQYNLIIEIMSLTYLKRSGHEGLTIDKIKGHSLTHNRRIFSNYFVIRAEHSLKIQRDSKRDSKMLYSQYVSLDWVASKGLIRYKDSDLPEECISDCIRTVKELINDEKNKEIILFSQNGEPKSISKIVNRLVK